MRPRYAVYYAPPTSNLLWRLGSAAIGYDSRRGEDLPLPDGLPWSADEARSLTEEPRRYGFHATLKAPFELAEGVDEGDLLAEAEVFARSHGPVPLAGLRLELLGSFVALVPPGDAAPVRALADECVRRFEPLRAPLSASDRERRLRAPLSERQIAQLDCWGYPYVFDDFRFHMTLTGELPDPSRETVFAALGRVFRPVLAPVEIDAVSIVRQDHRAGRFRIIADLPFGAAPQP